jgi:beta-lactam-binding protein with PASTA domain
MNAESQIIIRGVRTLLRIAWISLLLLIVALTSALVTMRIVIHGREIRVPDLRGKTLSEARQLAESLGLNTQSERQYYSATVPEGRVLSQVPEAGTTVRAGWQIRLAISLGPQRVTIPQLVGQSERAAMITIEQRALETTPGSRLHTADAPAGYVIAQDPPHDSTGISAPKVSLLIADSPTPEEYVTPSFAGQPLGTVSNTLTASGFTVGKVTLEQTPPAAIAQDQAGSPTPVPATANPPTQATPAPTEAQSATPAVPTPPPSPTPTTISPASIVVSQEPPPGQKIPAGSAVNFVVR